MNGFSNTDSVTVASTDCRVATSANAMVKALIGIAFVFLLVATACRNGAEKWSEGAGNPGSWVYLAAREARLREPTPNARIRDQRLDLTDAQVLSYSTLEKATNQGILVAMPSNFRTMLVTGSIAQAAIPENRGRVPPVVVDRKIEIHFLTQRNGQWFSTNVLRTRVISLTCSP